MSHSFHSHPRAASRLFFFLAAGVGIFCAATALALSLTKSSTSLVQLVPATVDLGQLRQVEKRRVAFELTNTSSEPVTVTRISTSCGCAVPEWTRQEIPPQSSVPLQVTLDSGNGDGPINRTVTAYLKDESAPAGVRTIQSKIVGIVRPDLIVNPDRIDLGAVSVGEPVSLEVTIARRGFTEPLEVLRLRSTHECLEVDTVSQLDNGDVRLSVTFTPLRYPHRYFSGQILASTNAPGMRSLTIPVAAEVTRGVSLTPQSVFLSRGSDGSINNSADVHVITTNKKPSSSIRLSFNVQLLQATIIPGDDPYSCAIHIVVNEETTVSEFSDLVTLIDNATESPLAAIPVRFLNLRRAI